jgi:DNA-binding NarL/FixJ family response regulator
MTNLASIIVVDDHKVFRKKVTASFKTLPDYKAVGEAFSGKCTKASFRTCP